MRTVPTVATAPAAVRRQQGRFPPQCPGGLRVAGELLAVPTRKDQVQSSPVGPTGLRKAHREGSRLAMTWPGTSTGRPAGRRRFRPCSSDPRGRRGQTSAARPARNGLHPPVDWRKGWRERARPKVGLRKPLRILCRAKNPNGCRDSAGRAPRHEARRCHRTRAGLPAAGGVLARRAQGWGHVLGKARQPAARDHRLPAGLPGLMGAVDRLSFTRRPECPLRDSHLRPNLVPAARVRNREFVGLKIKYEQGRYARTGIAVCPKDGGCCQRGPPLPLAGSSGCGSDASNCANSFRASGNSGVSRSASRYWTMASVSLCCRSRATASR